MTALSARGVGYRVGRSSILHDIDIDVLPGELVAVIGPNGAGKSTLLAALAGDIRPSDGEVLIDDRPLSSVSLAELSRMRSVLLQDSSVSFAYTVREVVAMARLPWQRASDREDDDRIVDDALHRMDVAQFADREITRLSGGEQARVGLARVLAQRCDIVLLDEPTAALDIRHQEQVLGTARALAEGGAAVLVVLHDLNLAAAHASRVVVMNDGCIVADGEPATIMTAELLGRVYRHPVDVIDLDDGLVIRSRRHEAVQRRRVS